MVNTRDDFDLTTLSEFVNLSCDMPSAGTFYEGDCRTEMCPFIVGQIFLKVVTQPMRCRGLIEELYCQTGGSCAETSSCQI